MIAMEAAKAEHRHRIACTNGLHDLAPQLGSERTTQSDGCPPLAAP